MNIDIGVGIANWINVIRYDKRSNSESSFFSCVSKISVTVTLKGNSYHFKGFGWSSGHDVINLWVFQGTNTIQRIDSKTQRF